MIDKHIHFKYGVLYYYLRTDEYDGFVKYESSYFLKRARPTLGEQSAPTEQGSPAKVVPTKSDLKAKILDDVENIALGDKVPRVEKVKVVRLTSKYMLLYPFKDYGTGEY
jgi:hypothetical protein